MTETFNYSSIRNEHGTNVLKQIRNLEHTSKTKGRFTSHLRFFMQCKHMELTPKCMKLKTTVPGNDARKIIKRTEKALLNIKISEVIKKKDLLQQKIQKTCDSLKEKLPRNLHGTIV